MDRVHPSKKFPAAAQTSAPDYSIALMGMSGRKRKQSLKKKQRRAVLQGNSRREAEKLYSLAVEVASFLIEAVLLVVGIVEDDCTIGRYVISRKRDDLPPKVPVDNDHVKLLPLVEVMAFRTKVVSRVS